MVLGLVVVAVVAMAAVLSLVVRRRRRSHASAAQAPAMQEVEQAIIDLRAEADATDDALRRAADRRAS